MKFIYRRIYLIDDNPDSLFITKYFLNTIYEEAEIVDFLSPEEGLSIIKEQTSDQKDLLLLDINMPTMTGWQFLEAVNEKWPEAVLNNTKVCIFTSSTRPADSKKAELHPLVSHYAEKPVSVNDMKIIMEALEKGWSNF